MWLFHSIAARGRSSQINWPNRFQPSPMDGPAGGAGFRNNLLERVEGREGGFDNVVASSLIDLYVSQQTVQTST